MTLTKKIRYLFKNIIRPDLSLFLAFLIPLGVAIHAARQASRKLPLRLLLLLGCLPFLMVGAFAPSPLFEQYFFPFAFFLVLGGAYALASVGLEARWGRYAAMAVGAAVLLAVGRGAAPYSKMKDLLRPTQWTPMEKHAEAAYIKTAPGSGPILTLEPIAVLEAGRRIYPEFSTGPFAWRISPYVEAQKAARLKILTPATLATRLAAEPPSGFLLGREDKGEEWFQRYVKEHGYRLHQKTGHEELWVRP